jgi:hypothetical protein
MGHGACIITSIQEKMALTKATGVIASTVALLMAIPMLVTMVASGSLLQVARPSSISRGHGTLDVQLLTITRLGVRILIRTLDLGTIASMFVPTKMSAMIS